KELLPIALAAPRDVLGDADDVAWPAGAEDHIAPALQDADTLWRAEDFRFARIIAAAGGEDIAILGDQDFSLLAREDVVIGFAEQLIARHTEEIFARPVEQDEAQLVGILYPDHVRDRVDDPVYQLVAEPARPLARLTVIRARGIACHHAYPTPHKRLEERSRVGQKSLWHRAPFWMHSAPRGAVTSRGRFAVLLRSHPRPSPERAKQCAGLGVSEEVCDFIGRVCGISQHRRRHGASYLLDLALERSSLGGEPALQRSRRHVHLGRDARERRFPVGQHVPDRR